MPLNGRLSWGRRGQPWEVRPPAHRIIAGSSSAPRVAEWFTTERMLEACGAVPVVCTNAGAADMSGTSVSQALPSELAAIGAHVGVCVACLGLVATRMLEPGRSDASWQQIHASYLRGDPARFDQLFGQPGREVAAASEPPAAGSVAQRTEAQLPRRWNGVRRCAGFAERTAAAQPTLRLTRATHPRLPASHPGPGGIPLQRELARAARALPRADPVGAKSATV